MAAQLPQGAVGENDLPALLQPVGQKRVKGHPGAELGADRSRRLRLPGQGEIVLALPPPQGGVGVYVPQGDGRLDDRLDIVKGEPLFSVGADVGKDQHAAALGVGLDLHGAGQVDARPPAGPAGEEQGLLRGERGGE